MTSFDPSRCKLPPRPYQAAGVNRLLASPRYGLFWEMRLGKTKAVVDAACALFDADELDVAVVACPAQVKGVWLDSEMGEIAKHGWDERGYCLRLDYNARHERCLGSLKGTANKCWVVASYEFLRQEDSNGNFPKVESLLAALRGLRWWLVCDEMAALGNWKTLQTRAVRLLSSHAPRVTGLDGTPVGNSPIEQWSKFEIIRPGALGYKNFWQFRARHAVVRKVPWTKSGQIVGFKGQEEIDKKVRPYCEFLSQDGLDLPEKVPTFFTAALSPKTWKVYGQMRDELVAELDAGTVTANHAAVKALRLAQICAGFVGGLPLADGAELANAGYAAAEAKPVEISREATDAFLAWLDLRLKERPDFKCVVWSRWRAEIERLDRELYEMDELDNVGVVYGPRKDENFLHPSGSHTGSGVMVCQPQAAQYGVSFAKADTEVFLSQDWNRVSRAQAEERVQGVGIRKSTSVVDVLVTGPNGERTVVHDIIAALKNKEEVARRTVEGWKKVLTQ